MRRVGLMLILLAAFIPLCLIQLAHAGGQMRLDEASTRVLFEADRTEVALALENPTGHDLPVRIYVELLDPEGRVRASAERDELAGRGKMIFKVPLPLRLSMTQEDMSEEVLWYRLHYCLTPESDASAGVVEGIISLSEITPEIFELRVVSPPTLHGGARYRVQARTQHPLNTHAVPDVRVEGSMSYSLDGQETTVRANGVTDAEGNVFLDFDIPRGLESEQEDLHLDVSAKRGAFKREAETTIELDDTARIMISTDKPLYQPGQVLHLRTLIFDTSKHALADTEASLEIEDPEGSTVYQTSLKTSRFGVASADWTIPDSTRLGDYSIRVELEEGDSRASQKVKISRYDLPNFVVNVKPDQTYYLPGQNGSVEVRADYLFGQPVKRGHVRVVRQIERRWNYREQKWETQEEQPSEGETDDEGRFIAHIDLQAAHAELAKNDYLYFQDLSYAAYFTDPTTNRTEQRRFDMRVTRDAIHIYINESGNQQAAGFPMQFYVSTFYADGTPAACEVLITEEDEQADAGGKVLRTISTNRYGVAKVSALPFNIDGDEQSSVSLRFVARDAAGATGRRTNDFWLTSEAVLRVETDKSLYRAGEPVRVQLWASRPHLKAVVNVWQAGEMVRSEVAQLGGDRATLVLPYSHELVGEVVIAAYAITDSTEGSNVVSGARTVLYPRERDLRLNVQTDKPVYRPGEEANARINVSTPEGGAVESALGVVVFDRAVEERARTDQEFGGSYGFHAAYRYLRGDAGELAGVTRQSLEHLDLSKPLPDDLALVAEMLLRDGDSYAPEIFGSASYETNQRRLFTQTIEKELTPLKDTLNERYEEQMQYPTDEASLRAMLEAGGLELERLRDPWLTNYRFTFSLERESDILTVYSAGADKRFDTADDFIAAKLSWPYFRPTGEMIDRALAQYHARTGKYVRDQTALTAALTSSGVDLDALLDRWGHPYRLGFGTDGAFFIVSLRSGGPNQAFEDKSESATDDFIVWSNYTDSFAEAFAEIHGTLARRLATTGLFPQNETELRDALADSKFDWATARDLWGQPFYATFTNEAGYTNLNMVSYTRYGDTAVPLRSLTPLTQSINVIRLRSRGSDGKQGTSDDFNVAMLTQAELAASNAQLKTGRPAGGASGAIGGQVVDPNGAVIPGAKVVATRAMSARREMSINDDPVGYSVETTSDNEGRYVLRNLPVGFYVVRISSPGFADSVVDQVPVKSSSITRIDSVVLNVAGTMMMVEVSAGVAAQVNTSSSTDSNNIVLDANKLAVPASSSVQQQNSTPRLREYFPETLVWMPSVETDAGGRAQIKFTLADNITTWKMSVIGSTVDGEIGIAEREIRAFQPFFVEHDPPRVLTVGDEIQLPVVVRNYLDAAQTVDVSLKPESWFALLGSAERREEVAAGDATRTTFDFRAVAAVKDGTQRITANALDAGDAIEKPVSVHPDGEEKELTVTQLLKDDAALDVNFPANTISDSMRAELKIYPNLMAHVIESIEGILERPHGCGEQTISSTYPSLLALSAYKRAATPSPVAGKAENFLRDGYNRLLNYRAPGGGFSYWGQGEEADLSLTAYALRFLSAAREFTQVDEQLIKETRDWLVRQQREDGSWPARYGDKDGARVDMQTAFIARALAMSERHDAQSNKDATQQKADAANSALKRALDYLQRRADAISDPHTIALIALAALDADEPQIASKAVARLRNLAQSEGGMNYWTTETGTMFYGWGMTATVETTALAVQALTRFAAANRSPNQSAPDDSVSETENGPVVRPTTAVMAQRGLLFLLRRKDRYGVWYSTQTTINALDAIVASLAEQDAATRDASVLAPSNTDGTAEIFVNGRRAAAITMPPAGRLVAPLHVSLTPFIAAGNNRVEIHQPGGSAQAFAQIVQTYYVPWSREVSANGKTESVDNGLRLAVSYDRVETQIGAEITCRVEAERVKNGSYGMLLAEIGLPPGAEVDRAALEKTMKESGRELNRYDILPDRLVVYLWPRTGGTRFEFKFRPRFGLNAQSAPSVLYDYYNPLARTVVAPTKFQVR